MEFTTFYKLELFSGGYGSDAIHITVDPYGDFKVEQIYDNGDSIVSETKETVIYKSDYNKMMKIVKIVRAWKDRYDQPGLCDGPEITISIDDKKTYIHSVSSKYYPKHYKKVIRYFNTLANYAGLHV